MTRERSHDVVIKVFEVIHVLKCFFGGDEVFVAWWRHGFSPDSSGQLRHNNFWQPFEKRHRVERTGEGVMPCYLGDFQCHGDRRVVLHR